MESQEGWREECCQLLEQMMCLHRERNAAEQAVNVCTPQTQEKTRIVSYNNVLPDPNEAVVEEGEME